MDEVHLGQGDVGHAFIADRLVVQQLCDCLVARVDRRDNTMLTLRDSCVSKWSDSLRQLSSISLMRDGVVAVLNNGIVVQQDGSGSMSAPLHIRQCQCRLSGRGRGVSREGE